MQNVTAVKFLTVYPNVYVGIWKALQATCPMDMFNEQVQGYLNDMATAGIVKIDLGYVTRVPNARNCLPKDFAAQLKAAA